MKFSSAFVAAAVGLLACIATPPLLGADTGLPEKLRSVLTRLDTFEAEQIAAAEKAIEKKRAEVSALLRTEMEKYARDGKVDTAVAIRAVALELEKGSPLDKIRSGKSRALSSGSEGRSQTVFHIEDFEEIGKTITGNPHYAPAVKRGILEISVKQAGPKYEAFGIAIPPTDFSERPMLRLRARAEQPVVVRIDLQDADGNGTTTLPVLQRIPRSAEFREFSFDFSNHAGKDSKVDLTRIQNLVIFANPGGDPFEGMIHFESMESSARK